MKKIITMIFIIAVCMMSCVIGVYAECNISVSNVNATPGETIAVNVEISGNTGMAIGKIKLDFDKTKLMPIQLNKGSVLDNAMYFSSNLEDENTDASDLDYINFTWMSTSNLNDNGNLATILFVVKSNINESIVLDAAVQELADVNQKDVSAQITSGKINVSSVNDNKDTNEYLVGVSKDTVSKDNSTISGDINLSVYAPKNDTLTFIIGVYDSDGILIATDVVKKNLSTGVNDVIFDKINERVNKIGIYAVKIYSWDSLEGMKPITETIIKTY